MSLSDPRLRRAALLCSGAWAVHELRFTIAPVDGGVGPGHAYLHAALPLLTVLVALAATGFAARLVAPRREPGAPSSLRADWASCAAVLLVSFVLQESGESLLSAHGPVFAAGGWWGAPLAAAIGLAVAVLLRGARAAVAAGTRIAARLRVAAPPLPVSAFAPPAARRPADAPLRHLAARPPPGSLVHPH
ncbi:MAG: hypothetical protein E6G41_08535 [Actinobacteria bacterium]|nr:MAG: hypothetical protein E6G41_08535 [Actinomycetota bacterium]